ncbi:MAG: hypothetical protein IJW79_06310 [Clostridia bacterium]|nr:hypothetical protein [Clostridia bacterium]
MEKYCFESEKYIVEITENGKTRRVPVYIALVCDGDGNNKKLPPEIFAEWNGLGMGTNTTKTYFSTFDFSKEAEVTVCLPENVGDITVKPEVSSLSFSDGKVKFKTSTDVNFVIEPDGDIFGGLHIFANVKKEIVKDKTNVIEFLPGVHNVENCPRIKNDEFGNPLVCGITDDTLVYIHEGAVVCADIELIGLKNVRIAGTGVLSTVHRCHGAENGFADSKMWGAFRYGAKPSILIRSGCKNVEIENLVLNSEFRNITIRNSDGIKIKNVKMFSSAENADGINCYNTRDILVDGCYIWSCDDCFCMYNACDSIPTLFDAGFEEVVAVSGNAEVKNCVMCSASRPIVIGGHATGETNPRCVIENIHIHDCYIVETPKRIFGCPRERELIWSGHLRLLSQSEQAVRNICFSDLKIDYTKGCISKPVHIEVRDAKNASYTESQGYRIENITFRNIEVCGHTEERLPIIIKSREPDGAADCCGIDRVAFDNFTINGKHIEPTEMIVEGPVNNLSIV